MSSVASAVLACLGWGAIIVFVVGVWAAEVRDACRGRIRERAERAEFNRRMDERAARSNVYPIHGRQVQASQRRPPVREHAGGRRR